MAEDGAAFETGSALAFQGLVLAASFQATQPFHATSDPFVAISEDEGRAQVGQKDHENGQAGGAFEVGDGEA